MSAPWDWLSGDASSGGRIWTAIAPALVVIAYVLGAAVAYVIRSLVIGRFHDEEMDHRGLGGLTSARLRHFFAWLMRPLWRGLVLAGVPPNVITTLSVSLALGAGVALAAGRFALGGWLYLAAGALDFLDGRVARATGRQSSGGAILDSVLDRYCESAAMVGLAWYYRESWVLFACMLALTGSFFVPYVRARGEAMGAIMSDVGFMQRPERTVIIGLTAALSPILEAILVPADPHPPHRVAIVGIVLVAITSHVTALQRLAHLVQGLGEASSRAFRPLPRSIVVSGVATALDFGAVWILVSEALPPPLATAMGSALGGVTGFMLSRTWAFDAERTSGRRQALRYAFVAGTSAALNAGGVAVLLLLPYVDYKIAWAVARFVVFATWNYPCLRDYVFAPPGPPGGIEGIGERGASRA